jgi:hypothetical protein
MLIPEQQFKNITDPVVGWQRCVDVGCVANIPQVLAASTLTLEE